tara:strand:- start:76 stop:222 length:147 start_codon:yes stop_codon:yes gene_type:complete
MQESARWSDGCRNHFLFAMGFKNVRGIKGKRALVVFLMRGEKAEIFFE